MVLFVPVEYRVRPETVTALADRLEGSSDTGAVCPAVDVAWNFPTPEGLARTWRAGELPGAMKIGPGETPVDYPRGGLIMVRRGLLRAMNWLDKRFGDSWSDLEMCSRIRDGNKKILVLDSVPVDREPAPPEPVTDLEWIDSAHGIATWIGIHHGMGPALKFRLGAALHALGRGKPGTFLSILSFTKIDGNQGG
jgi:hypothetical protein